MDSRFTESGASQYTSPIAGEQEATIKATPGKLFYLRACNTTAAVIFVFLFNGTNADPILCPPIPVPANGQVELQLPFAIGFSEGLTIGASSTQVAYAAGGANDMQIHVVSK